MFGYRIVARRRFAAAIAAAALLAAASAAPASALDVAQLEAIFLPSDLENPSSHTSARYTTLLGAANDVLVDVRADRKHIEFYDPDTLVVGNPLLRCLGTVGHGGCATNGTFSGFKVFTGDGADRVRSNSFADIEDGLHGGAGDDELVGGPGKSHLVGDEGSDRLSGGLGDDSLLPDSGTNNPAGGADDLLGGAGIDNVAISPPDASVTVTLDDVADDGAPGEGDNVHSDVERVFARRGTPCRGCPRFDPAGGDTLVGNELDNELQTTNGPASLSGLGGDDRLGVNATSSATIAGGTGDDEISDSGGAATIDGGDGDDVITSTGYAGAADTIVCGNGIDQVFATADDSVAGDCESVTIIPA